VTLSSDMSSHLSLCGLLFVCSWRCPCMASCSHLLLLLQTHADSNAVFINECDKCTNTKEQNKKQTTAAAVPPPQVTARRRGGSSCTWWWRQKQQKLNTAVSGSRQLCVVVLVSVAHVKLIAGLIAVLVILTSHSSAPKLHSTFCRY